MQKQIPVITIFAPTACGKTALATRFFGKSSLSRFKGMGELISADSQAVYQKMNIGTAKADESTKRELPHHMIDLLTPDIQFGAGEFVTRADSYVQEIWSRGKFPLLVGGTGFYIRNFLLGLSKAPESNLQIRSKIKERMTVEGNKKLYYELKSVDPVYAKRIHINDEYRIIRALEVYYSTGKALSSYGENNQLRSQYDFATIILTRDRKELYERIDQRVEEMFKEGLPEEVQKLVKEGYDFNSPGMKAIGYSEFFDSQSGVLRNDLENIKNEIKHHSHRYAKRQYTFMRDIPGAVTIHADDEDTFCRVLENFCSKYMSMKQNFPNHPLPGEGL